MSPLVRWDVGLAATSGSGLSGGATAIVVVVTVIVLLIPGVVVGRRALAEEQEKSPEELARLNPRLTLGGHWGAKRIGLLASAILFFLALWRSQGLLIATIAVASGLAVAGIGAAWERRWLRKRGWKPPSEREP